MKTLTEPSVFLVARTTSDDDGLTDLLDSLDVPEWASDAPSDAEQGCEIAGRLCYLSFKKPRPGGNNAYLQHIKEVGHGSVLEHANYSFVFTGISRSLSHELVRHRAGMGYSQLSQRYVNEEDAAFVLPEVIANNQTLYEIWKRAVETSQEAYTALTEGLEAIFCGVEDKTLRRKKAREVARSVLPNATETMIYVTGNARAWRHFLEMRASPHADVEIRRLAVKVWRELVTASPNLFGDYTEVHDEFGTYLTTEYRKV